MNAPAASVWCPKTPVGSLFKKGLVYEQEVYLVTALVPSDTACLASSPGRIRRTAFVEDVRDERVHDRHGLGGDTSVRVNLLQHLVNVDTSVRVNLLQHLVNVDFRFQSPESMMGSSQDHRIMRVIL